MSDAFNPDGYILSGVTENKDENGDHYEAREFVLSFEPDDAGNIDMRISDAEPLFNLEKILFAVEQSDSLEEVKDHFPDFQQKDDAGDSNAK